jgi:DNA invertase Pin-like site-specific DNA recombinase
MLIGYARVSSKDQNLDRQLFALKETGCEKIYFEKISSFSKTRPELDKMLDEAVAGDTIVVIDTDRLARDPLLLFPIIFKIGSYGLKLKSLTQGDISLDSPEQEAMTHMRSAWAKFEHSVRARNQRQGIEARRRKGLPMGRPRKINGARREWVLKARDEGKSYSQIADIVGCGKSTVSKICKEERGV